MSPAIATGTNTECFVIPLATAQRTVVAISSAAAAYASDGTIVALGNSQLSWKRVALDPGARAKAEIALLDPADRSNHDQFSRL